MKIRSITLDDESMPATVIAEMTRDEAALVARLTGGLSPKAITTGLKDVRWVDVSAEIYNCLTGELFNRFWDDGTEDVIPVWPGFNKALLPADADPGS